MMNGHEQVPLVKFIERPKCHKMLLNEVQCFPISNFQEFTSAGSIFMRKFFLSSHFSHQVSFIHRKPSHIRRGPFVTSRCQSDLSFTYGLANNFIDDDLLPTPYVAPGHAKPNCHLVMKQPFTSTICKN